MILPVLVLGGIALVPLRGGSLRRLADVRIRRAGLAVVAVLLQIVLIEVLADRVATAVAVALHLASYAAALAFVWANRRDVGLVAMGVGGLLNLAAIAANDGVMPADVDAVARAGLADEMVADGFENSAPAEGARLAALGDVFAVPEPLPLANVFSIGDVLIVAGSVVFVHRATAPARAVIASDVVATA